MLTRFPRQAEARPTWVLSALISLNNISVQVSLSNIDLSDAHEDGDGPHGCRIETELWLTTTLGQNTLRNITLCDRISYESPGVQCTQ